MVTKRRRYGQCRLCEARILFVQLDTGKVMPVDANPVDMGGNVAIRNRAGQWLGYVITHDHRLQPGYRAATSHFATCPKRKRDTSQPAPPPPATLF